MFNEGRGPFYTNVIHVFTVNKIRNIWKRTCQTQLLTYYIFNFKYSQYMFSDFLSLMMNVCYLISRCMFSFWCMCIIQLADVSFRYDAYIFFNWQECCFLTALPLLTMLSHAPVGSTVTSAYVISHLMFNQTPYGNNLVTQLTIDNRAQFKSLVIDFIVFETGVKNTCNSSGDKFSVYADNISNLLHECGDTDADGAPRQLVLDITSAQEILIQFITDETTGYRGFFFKYSCMVPLLRLVKWPRSSSIKTHIPL